MMMMVVTMAAKGEREPKATAVAIIRSRVIVRSRVVAVMRGIVIARRISNPITVVMMVMVIVVVMMMTCPSGTRNRQSRKGDRSSDCSLQHIHDLCFTPFLFRKAQSAMTMPIKGKDAPQ